MVEDRMYNKKRQDVFNHKSLLFSPSLTWTLSYLIIFKGIWWVIFSQSLVQSLFFFFAMWFWERTAAASASRTILSPMLFLQSFPLGCCLYLREGCAKMKNFKGGISCYVLPLLIQLASPAGSWCLWLLLHQNTLNYFNKVSLLSHSLFTEIITQASTDPVWSPCARGTSFNALEACKAIHFSS